jgi:hypothetical protein
VNSAHVCVTEREAQGDWANLRNSNQSLFFASPVTGLADTWTYPYRKSNPEVLMVQSAENGPRLDIAKSLNSTRIGCVLAQG